jgi:alpha-tubulin suppressor-like RCC1 family protein
MCALLFTGSVQCWGWNGYGNLGDGTRWNEQHVPVAGVPSNFATIAAGYAHVCALPANTPA